MYTQNYKKLIIYYFHKIICIAYLHQKNLQLVKIIFFSQAFLSIELDLLKWNDKIKQFPLKMHNKDDFWIKYRLYDDTIKGFPLKEGM